MSTEEDRWARVETKLDRLTEDGVRTRIAVAELTAALRTHVDRQTERTAARDRLCQDHEDRIRAGEQIGADEHGGQIAALQGEVQRLREWRARLAGIAATVGALVGGPIGALAAVMARHP